MLNAQFRPLENWPGKRTISRRDATFRATYPKTLDELEYELSRLSAREIVIQVEGLTRDDIRNDGWPRAGNWANGYGGPGVIVSFESSKGAISMPCDKFGDWKDNLRAIAKSLEALRMVDRYGVTRGNEQYRGWARLEAPPNGHMDRDQAASFIAGILQISPAEVLQKPVEHIRSARFRTHPDRSDGDIEKFMRIRQAEEVLTAL